MSEELRAWKDEDYRELGGALPQHPAGQIDLSAIGGNYPVESSDVCIILATWLLSCTYHSCITTTSYPLC